MRLHATLPRFARVLWCCLAVGCASVLGIHDPSPDTTADARSDGKRDGATCPRSPCDLLEQCGCPSGEACDISGSGTICRTAIASGTDTTACANENRCAIGYSCINEGDASRCEKLCDSDSQCTAPRGRCVEQIYSGSNPIAGVVTCTSDCDPMDTTQSMCPPSWTCDFGDYLFQGSSYPVVNCRPDGLVPAGGYCGSGSGTCGSDYTCVYFDNGSDLCEHICAPPSNTGCSGGTTCHSFTTPFVVAGTEYGACW